MTQASILSARPLPAWAPPAAVALLYWATGRLGLLWALPPGVATPVWPPSGIALAAVLAWGPGVWPGILLGSMLVNAPTLLGAGASAAGLAALSGIAAGSTLQALVGAAWLGRALGSEDPFARVRSVMAFAGIEAASCVVAATLGSSSLCLTGFAPWADFVATWQTWWLGDLAGILIAAPLWLAWERRGPSFPGASPLEGAALAGGLALASWLSFGPRSSGRHVEFLLLPAVAWAASSFGPRGATAAVAAATLGALAGTTAGNGPFLRPGGLPDAFLLQAFLGVIGLTGLLLAAAVEERRLTQEDLEKRVRERTGELREELILRSKAETEVRRLNAELQAFSHTAAHDLRSPLRAMGSYAQLVLDRAGKALDETSRDQLRRVVAAGERLSRLIDDLLGLALATEKPLAREAVDLTALAREVADELAQAEPRRKVEFLAESGLTGLGDRSLLRIALQNLLSNAWKFTAETPSPSVAVGSKTQEGGLVYFVRDNGAGFEPSRAGRLFTPFFRLHDPKVYPGTGVGLATVRRVMQRHGGRVWAEASPGAGATFYFTLGR